MSALFFTLNRSTVAFTLDAPPQVRLYQQFVFTVIDSVALNCKLKVVSSLIRGTCLTTPWLQRCTKTHCKVYTSPREMFACQQPLGMTPVALSLCSGEAAGRSLVGWCFLLFLFVYFCQKSVNKQFVRLRGCFGDSHISACFKNNWKLSVILDAITRNL